MDIRLTSALISALVAIGIVCLNYFILEPHKQKREWKKKQLREFYIPLYGLLNLRMEIIIGHICLVFLFLVIFCFIIELTFVNFFYGR